MKKKQLASLTSNILNPFLVSMGMVVLLSLQSTSELGEAIKWSLISLALSVLPVFLVILYLVRNEKLESMFINIRGQRHKIFLLAAFCMVVACAVLYLLGAPVLLVATYLAALLAIVVFMAINFLWKISVHTAFVGASATILTLLYGFFPGAASVVLVPLTAWARTELEQHSLAQSMAGAILSASIVVGVFYPFGLLTS